MQRVIRRRLRKLEAQQRRRIELTAEMKIALDLVINEKQREIENLRAQMTIGVAQ